MVKADPLDALVVGAGPAGLAAAEASPRAAVASSFTTPHPRRRASSCWRAAAASTSPIPSRSTLPRPLRPAAERLGTAIAASARPTCAPGRRSGRRDFRRQLRPRLPQKLQGDAAAARLAQAPRRARRQLRPRRGSSASSAAAACASPDRKARRRRAPRRSCWRSAAPRGRGWAADGGWVDGLRAAGVEVAPLKPANCGFRVAWSAHLAERSPASRSRRSRLRTRGEWCAAKR